MLVNRWTFQIKPGRMDEAIEVINILREDFVRVYQAGIGKTDQLCVELEFENYTAYEAFWQGWSERPEVKNFLEAWPTLLQTSAIQETWHLV